MHRHFIASVLPIYSCRINASAQAHPLLGRAPGFGSGARTPRAAAFLASARSRRDWHIDDQLHAVLLEQAYAQASSNASMTCQLLVFIESLFVRWQSGGHTTASISGPAGLLSVRERDVMRLLGRGLSNKTIAQALSICPETVKSHVKRILVKLKAKTRAEAVSRASALGLV